MADKAFDEIGDVRSIRVVQPVGSKVEADATMCVLSWEGFKRTASDELYHAVWANATGERDFAAKFPCEIVNHNERALQDPYAVVCSTEKGWICEVAVSKASLEKALRDGDLFLEETYLEYLDAQEREEDAAASRAYP